MTTGFSRRKISQVFGETGPWFESTVHTLGLSFQTNMTISRNPNQAFSPRNSRLEQIQSKLTIRDNREFKGENGLEGNETALPTLFIFSFAPLFARPKHVFATTLATETTQKHSIY